MSYNKVRVNKGQGGWGKGLEIQPTEKKNKIVSVTGGGIHPVAQRIAELTGGEAVDGFKNSVPDDEIATAIIDCGGTARIGVYPMKGILTVDVLPSGPSGPLAKHINEDNFVSGVRPVDIELMDNNGSDVENSESEVVDQEEKIEPVTTQGQSVENEDNFDTKYQQLKAEHKSNQD